MKKLRMGLICVLVAAALLLSLNLIVSAVSEKEKENEDALKNAQDQALVYKQQISELEKKFAELKSEQYTSKLAYEEKISELELKLNAQSTYPTVSEAPKSDAVYTYTVSGNEITITSYKGSDKKLTIPQTIDGLRVAAIGREAFKGADFEEVILPSGLEKIDWFAFSGCLSLEDVTIPNSVNKIEYGAFDGVSNFKIHCFANSYAYKYAKSYGYRTEID